MYNMKDHDNYKLMQHKSDKGYVFIVEKKTNNIPGVESGLYMEMYEDVEETNAKPQNYDYFFRKEGSYFELTEEEKEKYMIVEDFKRQEWCDVVEKELIINTYYIVPGREFFAFEEDVSETKSTMYKPRNWDYIKGLITYTEEKENEFKKFREKVHQEISKEIEAYKNKDNLFRIPLPKETKK